jgi:hypothetical protein
VTSPSSSTAQRHRCAGREAELLITREWAILTGENDYTSDTLPTDHQPRAASVAEFLDDHRAEFL